jgi:hypothetical protein
MGAVELRIRHTGSITNANLVSVTSLAYNLMGSLTRLPIFVLCDE